MSREIIERVICDVDGTEANHTEYFVIGNRRFKIDMSDNTNKTYWEQQTFWMDHAEEVASFDQRLGVMVDQGKCRAYCKSIGIPVADNGKPNKEAMKAYAIAYFDGTLPKIYR